MRRQGDVSSVFPARGPQYVSVVTLTVCTRSSARPSAFGFLAAALRFLGQRSVQPETRGGSSPPAPPMVQSRRGER